MSTAIEQIASALPMTLHLLAETPEAGETDTLCGQAPDEGHAVIATRWRGNARVAAIFQAAPSPCPECARRYRIAQS
jgi:hypothetical protein